MPTTENTKYTFRLNVRDRGGRAALERVVPMWVEDQPYAWGDGPMYFAFTDRFRDGDATNDGMVAGVDPRANYQGGDFAGILASLREGYFDQLGVRVLWISPVNQNSHNPGIGTGNHEYSGYHGYWVNQPRTVEPHWGSMDDLRALTTEAHRHGIRVVLDLVNNQLHQEHPYYAMHPDWFNGNGACICGGTNCDWTTRMLDCWFASYLPDVNWTNMATVDQMISDSIYWLVESDADGFRVDAVKMMEMIATTTLRYMVHQTVETGNAVYWTVGETFSGTGDRPLVASYIGPDKLSGQFDFPLFWPILSAFAQNQGSMADLDAAVQASASAFAGAVMSPFLGNQDVARFVSNAAGQINGGDQAWTAPPAAPTTDGPYNQLFLAMVFTLTQPGVPLIYYGDEFGMPGAADPDNRRMMRFGSDLVSRESALLARVQTIGHLRSSHPGLMRGASHTLYTDGDGYVYARGSGRDIAIIALNRGTTSRTVHVMVPPGLVDDGTTLQDAYGGAAITVSGGGFDVPFTPQGASVWTVPGT